ncbi:CaiB/BaiF CoA transferase family protein [Streptomyces phaeochromogenes]|uniref:CaiB/BaiF CoA transferase family protein n=1 Tax=Streptomyces phaeochromogenes TaxID=1923 RepID=UPI00369D2701
MTHEWEKAASDAHGDKEAAPLSGPLRGRRVVEFAGLGPTPFAAMLLADLGADVLRVDRADATPGGAKETYHRGRPSAGLDLKSPDGRAVALRLVERADVVVEGFRPGVMERLGLGPDTCLERNPRLVYGRMTGWGQDGPWADRVGHDINYLALTGALDMFRRRGERPLPPMNLLGDFGGGSLYLLVGILAALTHADRTGEGQVVDAAIVDGVAGLLASVCGRTAHGSWLPEPGTNFLDTGAPFYEVYEASDEGHLAVGAIEPRFYQALLTGLGLEPAELPDQHDRSGWPRMKKVFAARFATRTRDDWAAAFDRTEACVTPVLTLAEAQQHPHLRARGTYVPHHGVVQPAVAPRLSRTPGALGRAPSDAGADTAEALRAWGVQHEEDRRSSQHHDGHDGDTTKGEQ